MWKLYAGDKPMTLYVSKKQIYSDNAEFVMCVGKEHTFGYSSIKGIQVYSEGTYVFTLYPKKIIFVKE
jgi:hypothetical protein